MEFSDIATLIQTGGQSALMILLWLVYQNWRTNTRVLETLKAIETSLEQEGDTKRALVAKVDDVHTAVLELPVNLMRALK